jgi:hypothetical protein
VREERCVHAVLDQLHLCNIHGSEPAAGEAAPRPVTGGALLEDAAESVGPAGVAVGQVAVAGSHAGTVVQAVMGAVVEIDGVGIEPSGFHEAGERVIQKGCGLWW